MGKVLIRSAVLEAMGEMVGAPISDPAATDQYLADLAREAAEDPESAEADQKGTPPLDP